MPETWMPGLRHDPGRGAGYNAGTNRMFMAVEHNTGGTNSYNICKWGRDGYNTGLCQILLPKVGVPWQFTEIDAKCYHAGSSQYGDYNPYGPGFEVERLSLDEPLSPDQATWLGRINAWCESEWGLPNVHYWGPRFASWQANFHGHVNHSQIHPNPDGLTEAEWGRITSPPAPIPPKKDSDPMLYVFNPHAPTEVWCISGNTRRHVTPDEWAFCSFVGTKALKVSAAWFDSVPVTVG